MVPAGDPQGTPFPPANSALPQSLMRGPAVKVFARNHRTGKESLSAENMPEVEKFPSMPPEGAASVFSDPKGEKRTLSHIYKNYQIRTNHREGKLNSRGQAIREKMDPETNKK